ncbi:MAG: hypothetical protein NZM25_02830 [Leptospiraceae bacterium]|nr:hypothetical protein [Leptospiraceae bacterium]MDW8307203.1 hypothetical protein [Leptospiraceae bacterium]
MGIGLGQKLYGREFNGFKLEYMNAENTNFYGFGLFSSDRRFDAEMEFFFASKLFKGESEDDAEEQGPDPVKAPLVTSDYRFWFMSFSAYFHFLRTDKATVYLGSGIMPLLPQAYSYHWTVGMSLFWSDHFRVFYSFRHLINNAQGRYRFPAGPSMAFGLKYSFDFMSGR